MRETPIEFGNKDQYLFCILNEMLEQKTIAFAPDFAVLRDYLKFEKTLEWKLREHFSEANASQVTLRAKTASG